MNQDALFLHGEGNAWFRRNRRAMDALESTGDHDWPSRAVELIAATVPLRSFLELGCSKGSRLALLRRKMGDGARFVGVDASGEAIAEGGKAFPGIELRQGLLGETSLGEAFDCVIVNFVLHWLDRASLSGAVAEIDGYVKDGGYLILGDFAPGQPQKRRYHHLAEHEVFTYKQDYPAIFRSLGLYQEVASFHYNHDIQEHPLLPVEPGARASCTVLRKSITAFYPEVGS